MQGRVVGYRKLLQLNRQKLCFGILFFKFITKHSFGSSLAGTSRFSLRLPLHERVALALWPIQCNLLQISNKITIFINFNRKHKK